MSLSSLPTGTIGGGSGSRTYPPDEYRSGRTAVEPTRSTRPSESPPTRDDSSIRRENEALRRANARLKEQLDTTHENRHAVIDHYERLLAERYREHAQGRSPQDQSQRSTPSGSRSQQSASSGSESSKNIVSAAVWVAAERVRRGVGHSWSVVGRTVTHLASKVNRR